MTSWKKIQSINFYMYIFLPLNSLIWGPMISTLKEYHPILYCTPNTAGLWTQEVMEELLKGESPGSNRITPGTTVSPGGRFTVSCPQVT